MACKTTCAMARTPQAKATMPKAKAPRSDFVSWCWIPMSMMNVWKIIWKVIVARSWSLSRSADGFGPGLIDTSESSLWKVRKAFLLKLCFLLVHPSSSWLFQSLINSKNEKMAEGNKKIEKKSRAKKWRGLSSILSGVFQTRSAPSSLIMRWAHLLISENPTTHATMPIRKMEILESLM